MLQEEYSQKVQSMIQSTYSGRRILVTGGCGFIGSYLVQQLVDLGAHVTVLDAQPKPLDPRVRLIQADVRSYEAVLDAMKNQEYVFHLAAILGVERILHIPLQVMEINLGGTKNILQAADACAVKRVIYTSSSEVYGEPRKIPICENDPTGPVSIYGVAKLAAEDYCEAFFEERGLAYTCLRLFNVYGPGQTEKFVMPIFISRVFYRQSPIIYGDGSQSRSYTYITDAVNGILLAGASEKAVGQTFNIGNDEVTTIQELAGYIIQLSGNHLRPVYKNLGEGIRVEKREIIRRQPDISKARQMLLFDAQVPWKEGVHRFTEWYRQKLKEEIYGEANL